ncbi:dihydrodipicolinate synthase family protein [Micromonospora sp. NBC_01739]|uniref:dihydrodipicolinate synthase family protein n=1 Tax=Micromonospora sp. NBC_01739 TaxID=2975985 RepID=UPI002E150909|nr:dihydrodipicolinate synthase family protein [Micromonospora sp. NBC_01739]
MTPTGLYVPLITPFDTRGEVDQEALTRLADQVLAEGAEGLVALGTTGEPHALNAAEQRTVLDLVGATCRRHRAGFMVGAHTAEDLRALAGRPGVTAALCLVPPFLRPGEEAVLAHFARLAEVSPVPLVAYHVPYRTGQTLSVGALRRLAELPQVVGVKHAVGGIDADTIALLADPPPDFAVLGGEDAYLSPLLALGAPGGIVASAHLATADHAALVTAWREGDLPRARPLGHRLATLSAALFAEPNPAVIKAVLHAQGRIPSPAPRPPLLPATAEATARALTYAEQLAGSRADAKEAWEVAAPRADAEAA